MQKHYEESRAKGYSKIKSIWIAYSGTDSQKVIDFVKSVSFINIIRNVILFFLLLMTGPFALLMFIYWDKIYRPIRKQ